MQFLCAEHKKAYYRLTDEQLLEQWLEWMCLAGQYYQAKSWQQALMYAGNAYDLSLIRLDRAYETGVDAMAQVTLSASYLANIFQHTGHWCEARNTLIWAGECLECFESMENADTAKQYRACLKDAHMRDEMIGRYLNLPYRPVQYWRGLH